MDTGRKKTRVAYIAALAACPFARLHTVRALAQSSLDALYTVARSLAYT